MKQAWFCPSCQKHHAPHCDTCPGLVDLVSQPLPSIPVYPPHYPTWGPNTAPYWWQQPITVTGIAYKANPDVICMNGDVQ